MLANMSGGDLRAALIELCRCGLLTCTRGQPGETSATYALAWLPLDNSNQYSDEVRDRHAENMRRLIESDGASSPSEEPK